VRLIARFSNDSEIHATAEHRLLKLVKNYEPRDANAAYTFSQVHQREYTLQNYRPYFKENDRRSADFVRYRDESQRLQNWLQ